MRQPECDGDDVTRAGDVAQRREPSWQVPGYRPGAVIGRGGFATVYQAEQLSLHRQVALKVLLAELVTDADHRRFGRERDILVRLSGHPHIVDLFDAGITAEQRPFLVMRLYRSGSLAAQLQQTGPLPLARTTELITKIAAALTFAHGQGILHRDVKPENVLLTDAGDPVLSDFGISTLLEQQAHTRPPTACFTISHAAPEILEHQRYSVASDVYALASTTYQLLAGTPAYGSGIAAITQILTTDPPPLPRPDLPPAIDEVIRHGMARDPNTRPTTPDDFARALHDAAHPHTITPTPATAPPTTPAAGRPAALPTVPATAPPTIPAAGPPAALPTVPATAPPTTPAAGPAGRGKRCRLRLIAVAFATSLMLIAAVLAATHHLLPSAPAPPGTVPHPPPGFAAEAAWSLWASPTVSPAVSIPTGRVAVLTPENQIVLVAPADGRVLWRAPAPPSTSDLHLTLIDGRQAIAATVPDGLAYWPLLAGRPTPTSTTPTLVKLPHGSRLSWDGRSPLVTHPAGDVAVISTGTERQANLPTGYRALAATGTTVLAVDEHNWIRQQAGAAATAPKPFTVPPQAASKTPERVITSGAELLIMTWRSPKGVTLSYLDTLNRWQEATLEWTIFEGPVVRQPGDHSFATNDVVLDSRDASFWGPFDGDTPLAVVAGHVYTQDADGNRWDESLSPNSPDLPLLIETTIPFEILTAPSRTVALVVTPVGPRRALLAIPALPTGNTSPTPTTPHS